MIDSRATTRAQPEEELRFTRSTVALLLFGALIVGAVAGSLAALLVIRSLPEGTVTSTAPPRPASRPASAIKVAEQFTVAITTLDAPLGTATPTPRLQRSALGTGAVLDGDGHILTTSQVIGKYDQVQIVFYDGRAARGTMIGRPDKDTGLVVLKVSAQIPSIPRFADPDRLAMGDPVVAIGTSLSDLRRTADVGSVNLMGRKGSLGGQQLADNLIQTDARAPDGAAGGPLVDMRGDVVGFTVAASTTSSDWSLVLPAETARGIARRLTSINAAPGASLGITHVNITPQLAKLRGLSQQSGALVLAVLPKSPAHKVLRRGDIIISLDGKVVNEQHTLESRLAAYRPGQKVRLQVVRKDNLPRFTLRLVRKPAPGDGENPTEATP